MSAYILRRVIQAIIIIFIVSLLVFLVIRLLPGDPVLMYVSQEQIGSLPKEQIEMIRAEFGLDKPIPVQYINWIGGLFHGDLGQSLNYRMPVSRLIAERTPRTLYVGLVAFVLGNLIGVLAGIVTAVRRGKTADFVVTLGANIGITIPIFWLGIILIYLFGLKLGWLPVCGYTAPTEDFWLSIKMIIMPVICLSAFTVGAIARQTRSSLLEVTRQDYIRTAWSKGLGERTVVFRHILKNGLIPVLTLAGMQLSNILGGEVLIETVFNIPGMGRLAVDAVMSLDYAVVEAVVLLISAMVVIVNLVVDISYGWLDPRIRYN
jgi:peptide/nickel transport system permease protein